MIESAGYACDCASSGSEALEKVKCTPYPLVLMDCMLGGWLDGWSTASKIRELFPGRHTLIVAVTGLENEKELFDRCLAAGMDDVAFKPLHKDTLHEWLKRIQSSMGD